MEERGEKAWGNKKKNRISFQEGPGDRPPTKDKFVQTHKPFNNLMPINEAMSKTQVAEMEARERQFSSEIYKKYFGHTKFALNLTDLDHKRHSKPPPDFRKKSTVASFKVQLNKFLHNQLCMVMRQEDVAAQIELEVQKFRDFGLSFYNEQQRSSVLCEKELRSLLINTSFPFFELRDFDNNPRFKREKTVLYFAIFSRGHFQQKIVALTNDFVSRFYSDFIIVEDTLAREPREDVLHQPYHVSKSSTGSQPKGREEDKAGGDQGK